MQKFKITFYNFVIMGIFLLIIEYFVIKNTNKLFLFSMKNNNLLANESIINKYKLNLNVIRSISWPYLDPESFEFKSSNKFDLDYSNKYGVSNFDTEKLIFYDATGKVFLRKTNTLVYSTKYEYIFDLNHNNSYRKSDIKNKNVNMFNLHIGDSFVFGEGVDQSATITSLLNKKLNNYNNYNFGVPGNGPNDHYHRISKNLDKRYNLVKEKSGIITYHFLDFHIDRAVCKLSCYRPGLEYRLSKPEYVIDANGKLVLANEHFYDKFFIHTFYKYFSKSAIVRLLSYKLSSYNDEEVLLAVKMINLIFLKYEEKLIITKKYIVAYPGSNIFNAHVTSEIYNKYGIIVLNYSNIAIKSIIGKKARIPVDGHPAAAYNYMMSEMIATDILNDKLSN